jgi:metal-responsive CopG/Arc/MetJ family transcriptional regulator
MVKKRSDPERVAIPMPAELLKRIDEYRWANRIPSRAEAIRQLVEAGLKAPKT